jgi:hypothetical protein
MAIFSYMQPLPDPAALCNHASFLFEWRAASWKAAWTGSFPLPKGADGKRERERETDIKRINVWRITVLYTELYYRREC